MKINYDEFVRVFVFKNEKYNITIKICICKLKTCIEVSKTQICVIQILSPKLPL